LWYGVLLCTPLRQFGYWQSGTTTREDQVNAEAGEEDHVTEAWDLVGRRGGQCVAGGRRRCMGPLVIEIEGNCALCTGLKKGHHSLFACSIHTGVMIWHATSAKMANS